MSALVGSRGCIGNSCFYQPLYPRVQLPRQRGVAGAEIGMIHNIRPHVRWKDVAQSRGDMNEIVIRSTMPRVTYKDIPNPPHDNEEEFQRGDVLIGNDNFGIYKNEFQIVLKPHKEPRKNKIGSIAKDELFLLDFIKPWTKFKLTGK